ncbi:hypothetical protein EDD15DRAFT_2330334 [Pisolithus albus]|nr:hypothetical protein EDD15DRAFT_2330334 [Pisolithus albus]
MWTSSSCLVILTTTLPLYILRRTGITRHAVSVQQSTPIYDDVGFALYGSVLRNRLQRGDQPTCEFAALPGIFPYRDIILLICAKDARKMYHKRPAGIRQLVLIAHDMEPIFCTALPVRHGSPHPIHVATHSLRQHACRGRPRSHPRTVNCILEMGYRRGGSLCLIPLRTGVSDYGRRADVRRVKGTYLCHWSPYFRHPRSYPPLGRDYHPHCRNRGDRRLPGSCMWTHSGEHVPCADIPADIVRRTTIASVDHQ